MSKTSSTIVCENCGSDDIQQKRWVDPNTLKPSGGDELGKNDMWCNPCEDHTRHITHKEFTDVTALG